MNDDHSTSTGRTPSRSTLSGRVSTFYSVLDQVMSTEAVTQWADKLSDALVGLDYDLFWDDLRRKAGADISCPSTTSSKDSASAPDTFKFPARIRYLAFTIVKVLEHGGAKALLLEPQEKKRWEESLEYFNLNDRRGPKLEEQELEEILRASSAVFKHTIPPNDALDIVADYMFVKKQQNGKLARQILSQLEI